MGEVKLIFFILNPQNETLPPSLCFLLPGIMTMGRLYHFMGAG